MKIVFCGVGGQGVITLSRDIAELFFKKEEVHLYEIHGIAQRSGSVQCFLKTGKASSPLIRAGDADLIVSLEALEGLRASYYGSGKTTFLVNTEQRQMYGEKYPTLKEIQKKLNLVSKKVRMINGSDTIRKETGIILPLNSFLLGYVSAFLGFEKGEASSRVESLKYFKEENKKAFELGWNNGKKDK